MFRISAALTAEGDDRFGVGEIRLRLPLGPVLLLLDLPLDGKTVTVPARHVVGILAHHGLGSADHVFQDLVERVPDMEMPVGIRRAVMKHELGLPLPLFAQALIKPHLGPALQELRLALRQTRLHRKLRLGQEQRLAPIAVCLRLDRGLLGLGYGRRCRFRHPGLFRDRLRRSSFLRRRRFLRSQCLLR